MDGIRYLLSIGGIGDRGACARIELNRADLIILSGIALGSEEPIFANMPDCLVIGQNIGGNAGLCLECTAQWILKRNRIIVGHEVEVEIAVGADEKLACH